MTAGLSKRSRPRRRERPRHETTDAVAGELGAERLTVFQPWEKCGRGGFAQHAEIEAKPEIRGCIGKVVWTLDDITTTNHTLRSAVRSLMALEAHAHGLAWVVMARETREGARVPKKMKKRKTIDGGAWFDYSPCGYVAKECLGSIEKGWQT
ncbi:MAG: hypothetical protein NTW86_01085 [Candidatus Sumerlaeota bacterium]|nr:hypothetical protein [Candidatus Sumerlaeota bacterium]